MGVTYFSGSEPQYALRSYLVLVGLARTRSTITYEDLSDIIHRGGAHMMANALRPLRDWCRNNDLPPLTVLVVNKNTGLPGEGVEVANVPKAFADVYAHDWFEHLPPTLRKWVRRRCRICLPDVPEGLGGPPGDNGNVYQDLHLR